MIERRDLDHLAKKLGFESMEALQEDRKAEERARFQAKMDQEARARALEIQRAREAEDAYIRDGLDRLTIALGGQELHPRELGDLSRLACPWCKTALSFARELVLQALQRSSYHGDNYLHELPTPYKSRNDTIHAGEGRLVVIPEVLSFRGKCNCPGCGEAIGTTITAQVIHEGVPVRKEPGAQA